MSAVVLGLFFLACGWKFYKDFKCTRYLALKNSGHPQYFGGALCGALIFLVCLCLDATAMKWGFYREVMEEVVGHLPSLSDASTRLATAQITRVALWAMPAVLVLTRILNFPLHRSSGLILAIAKKTRIVDELEETLYYCLDRDLMVLITLKSKKVYVGIPKRHSPDPDRDRIWLALWPVASGCRDNEGALTFNTFYPNFDQLAEYTGRERSQNDFQLVVPISEIASAQSFDLDSFNKFSSEDEILAKLPEKPVSVGLASEDIKESTDRDGTAKELINGAASSDPPIERRDRFQGLSAEIVSAKDKHLLRCYAYYVNTLFLSIILLPYDPFQASLLLVVSFISAVAAIQQRVRA